MLWKENMEALGLSMSFGTQKMMRESQTSDTQLFILLELSFALL